MLARVYIQLQFKILVAEPESITIVPYDLDGYRVSICGLESSQSLRVEEEHKNYTINDINAIQTDILIIEFRKDEFARGIESEIDPSIDIINRSLKSFLAKYRWVTNSFQVVDMRVDDTSWELYYLNDDGSELEKHEQLLRTRGGIRGTFAWTILDKDIWDRINRLDSEFSTPEWHDLILQAYRALPSIGPAIVLAFTAIEVYIGQMLDDLAKEKIAPELWKWINNRNNLDKCPNTEEQLDFLLKFLCGKSLKSSDTLWQGFAKLRKARNSFVHEGCAVRLEDRKPISEKEAQELISVAWEILSFIRMEIFGISDDRPKLSVKNEFRRKSHPIELESLPYGGDLLIKLTSATSSIIPNP